MKVARRRTQVVNGREYFRHDLALPAKALRELAWAPRSILGAFADHGGLLVLGPPDERARYQLTLTRRKTTVYKGKAYHRHEVCLPLPLLAELGWKGHEQLAWEMRDGCLVVRALPEG